MTDTALSRWQDAEGWPTEDYINAVDKALADARVEVADGWADGRHDFTFKIASPIPPGFREFCVGWSVTEDCAPLSETGFTGPGWLWVGVDAENDGERTVGHFDLDVLAEPAQVAAAVSAHIRVALGFALMDERRPGWLQRIDLDRLDMASGADDILGQEFGHPDEFGYKAGEKELFDGDSDAAAAHGFTIVTNWESFEPLTAEWRRVILEARRNGIR